MIISDKFILDVSYIIKPLVDISLNVSYPAIDVAVILECIIDHINHYPTVKNEMMDFTNVLIKGEYIFSGPVSGCSRRLYIDDLYEQADENIFALESISNTAKIVGINLSEYFKILKFYRNDLLLVEFSNLHNLNYLELRLRK